MNSDSLWAKIFLMIALYEDPKNLPVNDIVNTDALSYLRSLPSNSVHCMVTSPPYWGLRDYGIAGQSGIEPTLHEFIAGMVEIFREARRVLRSDGVLWLNMGDSYATASDGTAVKDMTGDGSGLKPKDLIGQAWRLALALQDDGWYLRSDIIWSKPNPMPSSAKDRPTTSHEYVFLMSKSPRYWYDWLAIAEQTKTANIELNSKSKRKVRKNSDVPGQTTHSMHKARDDGTDYGYLDVRNKRTVWHIATKGFSEAHFATFPPKLIEPMILAGCPPKVCATCGAPYTRQTEKIFVPQPDVSLERGIQSADGVDASSGWAGIQRGSYHIKKSGWEKGCECNSQTVPGIVLDMFMGAATTALVATQHGRRYTGSELNPEYIRIARKRLNNTQVNLFSAFGIAVPKVSARVSQ